MASASGVLDERDQIAAEFDRRYLREFIRHAWSVLEPTRAYQHNWHIDAIADHLQAVSRGDLKNLLINIPPGCMKSYIVSVLWPAWDWITRPYLGYLCASHDQTLSTRDMVRVRDLVQSAWYQRRWPHVRLKHDQNQKTRFDTTLGGWRIGTSVGGRAVGEHPHVKIIDDPNKPADSTSIAALDEASHWFDQTLSTRGAGIGAVTVLIQQRLNERDLSGHIDAQERADWTRICLPMMWEPKRMVETPLGWQDPRTEPGELLWPEMFSAETLAPVLKELGSYGVAGQMQQRPAPAEGGMIKRHWWQWYQTPIPDRRPTAIVISVDPALKAKATSDYSAFGVWGVEGADVFALNMSRGRMDLPDIIREVESLHAWCAEHWPQIRPTLLVENTAAGPDAMAVLRRKVGGVVPETPKGDPEQRVHAVLPLLEGGNLWLPGAALPDGRVDVDQSPAWVEPFVEECAAFPKGAHDDQVAQWTQAVKRLSRPRQAAGMMHMPGL